MDDHVYNEVESQLLQKRELKCELIDKLECSLKSDLSSLTFENACLQDILRSLNDECESFKQQLAESEKNLEVEEDGYEKMVKKMMELASLTNSKSSVDKYITKSKENSEQLKNLKAVTELYKSIFE